MQLILIVILQHYSTAACRRAQPHCTASLQKLIPASSCLFVGKMEKNMHISPYTKEPRLMPRGLVSTPVFSGTKKFFQVPEEPQETEVLVTAQMDYLQECLQSWYPNPWTEVGRTHILLLTITSPSQDFQVAELVATIHTARPSSLFPYRFSSLKRCLLLQAAALTLTSIKAAK